MPNAPSILVVEHEPDVRAVIMAMVEQCGYRAAEAYDGSVGAEIMRAAPPVLVIANARLRGGDLANLADAMGIPVLLIGSVAPPTDRSAAFLLKPFRLAELERRIEELLRQKR